MAGVPGFQKLSVLPELGKLGKLGELGGPHPRWEHSEVRACLCPLVTLGLPLLQVEVWRVSGA